MFLILPRGFKFQRNFGSWFFGILCIRCRVQRKIKLGGVSWPRGHVSSPRVGAPVPGPELVAGLSQGQGRGWGLGCRPGECSLGRGSPAPAAHFPPRPRAERLTGSALLLRPRERAGPRGSALRTDLENRQTRCVCETEKARRPWSNPEGR